ncbi:hypothetical protein NE237_012804 [Protea cynaroides]|uniref:Uncharacterized protein n=1 Tax=Protea cynaroides TaxID=273540 RepID=A0A9Q0GZT2_9MAGN|nr:hypothetical protein NE237_012804 [Protea cynaroides]
MNFSGDPKESSADIDLSWLIDHFMSPGSGSSGLADHVKLGGRDVGAETTIHHSPEGESHKCCRINIYVNNNVQGVNNSILFGSKVMMRDPGVHSSWRDWNVDEGDTESKPRKRKMKRKKPAVTLGFCVIFLFIFLLLILLMSLF